MRTFIVLTGFLITCIGGYIIQRDLRLLAFGTRTTAVFLRADRSTDTSNASYSYCIVYFRCTDLNGKQRESSDRTSVSWQPSDDRKIPITYLKSNPHIAAIRGNWHSFHWMLFFFGIALLSNKYIAVLSIKYGYGVSQNYS